MNFDNNNALFIAAEKGDLATIQQFIATNTDINIKNVYDENLLFVACKNGHLDIVNFLLAQKNIDIESLNSGGQNTMHAACINGNVAIVKELITRGVNLRQLSRGKRTPVYWVFHFCHAPLIQYFLENNLVTPEDFDQIRLAGKDNEALKLLKILTPLIPTLKQNIIDKIFSDALWGNRFKCVQYMLEHFPNIKTDLGKYFGTLLDGCIRLSAYKPIIIKKTKSDVFVKYKNQFDISSGKNKALEFMLQNGLTMHTLDPDGQTILHYATTFQFDEYEHVSAVKVLLDLNYPIDLRNSHQQTPLHVAIQSGMFFHALYLIYSGADVNAVDDKGQTILSYAENFVALALEADDPYSLEFKQDLMKVIHDYQVK